MYREFQDKLDKLSAHKSKLTAQLEREEQRDYDELLKRAIDLVKKIKEQIKVSSGRDANAVTLAKGSTSSTSTCMMSCVSCSRVRSDWRACSNSRHR